MVLRDLRCLENREIHIENGWPIKQPPLQATRRSGSRVQENLPGKRRHTISVNATPVRVDDRWIDEIGARACHVQTD